MLTLCPEGRTAVRKGGGPFPNYPNPNKNYHKMNISRENRQGQTALIKVAVTEADYAADVDKKLREYKRKASIPGFRPGMVPMGVINKMYRKGVVAEEAYHVASQAAFDYIGKEKIDYVGDVMPAEEQGELDFENSTEHDFIFEVGLAPEVNIELSAKDKLTRNLIKADKEMYNGYRDNFLRRYGRLVDVDKVISDEALSVTLDNESMNIEDAYVGLISMSDEERKPFIGKKVGDVMDVDVNELYKTPSQRAAILQVAENELDGIDSKFKLTITRIRQFANPEMNEEFFNTAFPDGSVTDEKGLEAFINDMIARDLVRESDYVFELQVRKLLVEKADLSMPEDFIRRWLFTINEGKFPMEQIEKDMPTFLDMMRWNLVQKYFIEKLEIKVEEQELREQAKAMALQQFAQYGMMQVPDEMLENYATQIISKQDEARKLVDKIYETKVVAAIIPMLKVTDKEVTPDEFRKLAEEILK